MPFESSNGKKTDRVLLVTGAGGLIGSEVVAWFAEHGWNVHGVESNMRKSFFGPAGCTRWNVTRLTETWSGYVNHELDIRDRDGLGKLMEELRPNAIVHTAAQPSHDLAASRPFDDFDVNAVGTMNLLEFARRHCPESPFVHLSTNKVYGDSPNEIPMTEKETRWDYANGIYGKGISEECRIDHSKHSLFGASKVAADVMVQEYGRYFDMPTCCLRGGCLTGPNHSGVELHGFLSFLVKCNLEERLYRIFGYKAKQVRDNIHSHDVVRFVDEFISAPRSGEVYNLGGGFGNSVSILEAFKKIEAISGKPMKYEYVDEARNGDHVCYYSDLSKIKAHYPNWDISKDLQTTFEEIYESWMERTE